LVSWVYAHEDELIEQPNDADLAPEVVDELLRRRNELDEGNVQILAARRRVNGFGRLWMKFGVRFTGSAVCDQSEVGSWSSAAA